MSSLAKYIGILAILALPSTLSAQIKVGDNVHLNASGSFEGGYAGVYGDEIQSSHGINLGLNGSLSGDYFNPNFLNFVLTPYYNQSRDNSSYQSLSGASGIAGTANIFTGSHFPGSVSYHYDHNSTGTLGLTGVPDFTTQGNSQGFSVNWGLLFANWPTFSVGYSQGSGNSTLYGTDQETSGNNRMITLRSGYQVAGFRLSASFDHNTYNSVFPQFLVGQQEASDDSSNNNFDFSASHNLPLHGTFSASYARASGTSNYLTTSDGQDVAGSTNDYTTQNEFATATFHPTKKLGLFVNENFIDSLSGALNLTLINSGALPIYPNLGSGSHSLTYGGGANYQLTNYISAYAQATHYDQYYFGQNYSGNFVSGTINYNKKILDLFTVSAGVVDSSSVNGDNAVGFMGNINYFHRFGTWETSGTFSYAQNVQTLLITYTTSSYNYNARVRHRLFYGINWIAAFNGSHSGLSQQAGTSNHAESYSTSLSTRRFSLTANYSSGSGLSVLGTAGLVPLPPIPGVPTMDTILYGSSSYGGGVSATPLRRLTIAASYSRAISNTTGYTYSHNNTEVFNSQLQYRLRRISLLAGYTKFTQGISAVTGGSQPSTSSFFVGVSRWFNFF